MFRVNLVLFLRFQAYVRTNTWCILCVYVFANRLSCQSHFAGLPSHELSVHFRYLCALFEFEQALWLLST